MSQKINEKAVCNKFLRIYKPFLLYVMDNNKFYLFDKNRFRREDRCTITLENLIGRTIEEMYGSINGLVTAVSRVRKYLISNYPEIRILRKDLNRVKHFLSCKNGVVDLRTAEIINHSPDLRISMNTNIDIGSPQLNSDGFPILPKTFEKYISNLIFRHNPAITRKRVYALLKLIGLFLNRIEGKRLFLHICGLPRTGKSKLAELLTYMLGDYACSVSSSIFTTRNQASNTGLSPQLVEPMGKSLTIIDEPSTEKKMNSTVLKAITGGAPINARLLRENDMRGGPSTFTPIFISNCYLDFDDVDEALLERYLLIETYTPVSTNDIDPYLFEKLKSEASEILSIIVLLGATNYKDSKIEDLNSELYKLDHHIFDDDKSDFNRNHVDSVVLFQSEQIYFKPGNFISDDDLYSSYINYCEKMCIYNTLSRMSFINTFREKYRLASGKNGDRSGVLGIGINRDKVEVL